MHIFPVIGIISLKIGFYIDFNIHIGVNEQLNPERQLYTVYTKYAIEMVPRIELIVDV